MDASCEPLRVDLERALGLQQLLEPDAVPLKRGDVLPPLWHWVALPRWPDPSATGHDGHPKRPGPLAHVSPVRRMFAGGEVNLTGTPAHLGEEVSVMAQIGDVVRKTGRSGDFVLATFTVTVKNLDGQTVLTERQDVVYTDPRPWKTEAARDKSTALRGPLPIVGRPLTPRDDGGFDFVTDPTILVRFSALTANAHRIHYDLPYAQQSEHLPELLVHGPLLNLALAQSARQFRKGATVRRVVHRNIAPLYCGQPAVLSARSQDDTTYAEMRSSQDDTVLAHVNVTYDTADPSDTKEPRT